MKKVITLRAAIGINGSTITKFVSRHSPGSEHRISLCLLGLREHFYLGHKNLCIGQRLWVTLSDKLPKGEDGWVEIDTTDIDERECFAVNGYDAVITTEVDNRLKTFARACGSNVFYAKLELEEIE